MTFFVPGTPIPKGSMKAIPFRAGGRVRVAVKHDNARTKPWMGVVELFARQAMRGRAPIAGPVGVTLRFRLPRPKRQLGANGAPLPSAPAMPVAKPDLDKLVRGVFDALTGVCWVDDARVVGVLAGKEYGDEPGVLVEIEEVS